MWRLFYFDDVSFRIISSSVAATFTVSLAALLIGCGKSPPPSQQTLSSPAPSMSSAEASNSQQTQPESTGTASPLSQTPVSPDNNRAEDRLVNTLTQYSAADEETRHNLVEQLPDFVDEGLSKDRVAKALSSLFATEQSSDIKVLILDELEALDTPSLMSQVTPALSADQPSDVRDEAITILNDLGDKSAIAILQPLLSDADEDIREEAQDAINHLNSLP